MSLAVQIPQDSLQTAPPDSTGGTYFLSQHDYTTKFTLAGGGGRFYREIFLPMGGECASLFAPIEQDYVDVGAEFDYQASVRGHIGVRGGYVRGSRIDLPDSAQTFVDTYGETDQLEIFYLNTFFSFEWTHVGFGAGVIAATEPLRLDDEELPPDTETSFYPSAHLRFGDLDKAYISGHVLESVPIYSGGGLFVLGIGIGLIPHVELYGGWCSDGPYQEESGLLRVTYDINRAWAVLATARLPVEYSGPDPDPASEFGVSVGVTYQSIKRE